MNAPRSGGNRRYFRELLTRSEERIASNILADRPESETTGTGVASL